MPNLRVFQPLFPRSFAGDPDILAQIRKTELVGGLNPKLSQLELSSTIYSGNRQKLGAKMRI